MAITKFSPSTINVSSKSNIDAPFTSGIFLLSKLSLFFCTILSVSVATSVCSFGFTFNSVIFLSASIAFLIVSIASCFVTSPANCFIIKSFCVATISLPVFVLKSILKSPTLTPKNSVIVCPFNNL